MNIITSAFLAARPKTLTSSLIPVWAGCMAVSYTHLDVYKRQFQPLLEEGEQGKRRNADNENRSGIALDLVLVGTCLLYTSRCV